MAPIQQMLIGVGAKKKTYVNDVFSTYLYRGNSTAGRAINNGIDLSGEGGMTWIKARTADSHALFDTSRGVTKGISSNTDGTESTDTDSLTSFNSNGFSLGTGYTNFATNLNNFNYSSWSFRKAKGFFDVVTYTGTGTSTNADGHLDINHSLGSIPAMVIVKRTSGNSNWWVWHRNLDTNSAKAVFINSSNAADSNSGYWNGTAPTASQFTVGEYANVSGSTYVAYLFAGGESDAATARSVALNGSSSWIHNNNSSSDFTMGTGDFTVECWAKMTDTKSNSGVCHLSATAQGLSTSNPQNDIGIFQNSNVWKCWAAGSTRVTTIKPVVGVWTHLALVRHSGKTTLYVNGEQGFDPVTDTSNYDDTYIAIGGYYDDNYLFKGRISNFRVVKGTAVYTSSFRPSTEPLTNITNTKLLCCNNSSVTGSTVTPSTLNGESSTASTDSPFDDPAGFIFGESGDQNVIKCGSYVGNGSSTGPEIFLGWEPQWVLTKGTAGDVWYIFDSMRGLVTGGNDHTLSPDSNGAEDTGGDRLSLTPTGFKITNSNGDINGDGYSYIYVAIRRPDGYVGKPAGAGTDVFAMTAGTSNSDVPGFVSGFPVDYYFIRPPASTSNWWSQARLTGTKTLKLDTNSAETTDTGIGFDFNNGAHAWSGDLSSYQSWMWKRHAGFDVVTYKGDGVAGRQIPHSLNAVPEMMWVKNRDTAGEDWIVYHKGLDGGNQPETHTLYLNRTWAEADTTSSWNDTAPTATHFTLGSGFAVNTNNTDNIAMLFASVDGISKVGYYTGTGADQTITTGFQPRFIFVKGTNGEYGFILDTTRGWGSGNDNYLIVESTAAQASADFGNPVSTGFFVKGTSSGTNTNNVNYVYYAHA